MGRRLRRGSLQNIGSTPGRTTRSGAQPTQARGPPSGTRFSGRGRAAPRSFSIRSHSTPWSGSSASGGSTPPSFVRRPASKLRRLVSTGEHLSPDVIAAYEEAWDLTICDGYGQVETGIVVANGAGPGFRAGSIGLPLPGFEVAVVDEQGNEVEAGVIGDLALRGRPPALFSGYWNEPEETKAAFRGDWYVTGDVGASDEDGFLWFLGRAGDVILSGGGRFGPVEVEEALTHHAAVSEAAVVGMRDLQRGGQYVRAFVVLEPGHEPSDRLVAEIIRRRTTLDFGWQDQAPGAPRAAGGRARAGVVGLPGSHTRPGAGDRVRARASRGARDASGRRASGRARRACRRAGRASTSLRGRRRAGPRARAGSRHRAGASDGTHRRGGSCRRAGA
ncbi:MAG: hypothetical protein E6G28_01880 [Actinobacteria bacterium]|nr:MAG: hypothetical protein E6G28_01880 [Actinomycetota bacterium]